MTAVTAGGRPITTDKRSSKSNAMPDRYAMSVADVLALGRTLARREAVGPQHIPLDRQSRLVSRVDARPHAALNRGGPSDAVPRFAAETDSPAVGAEFVTSVRDDVGRAAFREWEPSWRRQEVGPEGYLILLWVHGLAIR